MRALQCRDTRSFLIKVSGVAIIVVALMSLCFPLTAYADDAAGAATFKAKCAMCHGADGAGKTPMGAKLSIPNLVSPEVQGIWDEKVVRPDVFIAQRSAVQPWMEGVQDCVSGP